MGPRQTMGVFSSTRKLMDMAFKPQALMGTKNFSSFTCGRLPDATPSIMPWLGP